MKQLLLLAALAALIGCSAASAYPKRPEGPVLDLADILPAKDEAALSQRLKNFWIKTGTAIVVVSVKSLEHQTIEQYAFGLFNAWGIGDAKANKGLLVVVAPAEHKVRIEVGCGLEGTISDAFAKQVIETRMIPKYKQGDLEGGTLEGVDALTEYLQSPAAANDNGPHSAICRARKKNAA